MSGSAKKTTTRKRKAPAKKTTTTTTRKTTTRKRKAPAKKTTTRKRKAKARRNPVDVVQRVPVIGDMGFARTADSEIAPMAHGAQKWGNSSMGQKAVQVVGGFTGYGYGGSFTQMGQGMSENVLLGSGAGLVTGVGGIAATSWAVNTLFGDMLLSNHENKHHTFANFTKGWKVGGYVGVGLNTLTNLLTMYYGRTYSGLGSWSQLVNEAQHGMAGSAVKKMVAKSMGAHKLAHIPAVAGAIGQGMYAVGPDAPLQGFAFGQNHVADNHAPAPAHYGGDYYTDVNGYYGDNNDVLGYVDVLGGRGAGNSIGGVDNLGYPSGIGYPAEFAENQPLYG